MSLYVNGAPAGIGKEFTSPFIVLGTATQTPFLNRITVSPDSSSYRAGLRTGDLVDTRSLPAAQRYRWFIGWQPRGERIDLRIVRGTGTHPVSDESEAIAQLAHGVGGALDILTLKAGVSLETLSDQLRDLRDTLVAELRASRTPL